jgi:hypothetical protein
MAALLHLGSSADLTGSVSRRLTARFAAGWAALGHANVCRDLFADQPPHLPSIVLHWAPSLRAADESVIGRMTATRRRDTRRSRRPQLERSGALGDLLQRARPDHVVVEEDSGCRDRLL